MDRPGASSYAPLAWAWQSLRDEAGRLAPLVGALGTGIWLAAARAIYRSARLLSESLAARPVPGHGSLAGHWSHRVTAPGWILLRNGACRAEQASRAFSSLAVRADTAILRRA